jgi:predicted RND superfamily exporter protein
MVSSQGLLYVTLLGLLIIAFAYFYNSIAFDPVRQADQIRRQGGFIPGIRPGPQTERYLGKVVNRITLPGAIFIAAIAIMFLVLLIHYGKLDISLLAISMAVLCVFGSNIGLWVFGLDYSISAVLGLISLVGIIVRNAIIMYDYVAELRNKELMSVRDAAFHAGLRRMRPIFLTSATTAIGVVPMILAGTMLWKPMGVVICFGTLFTLPLIVTILPVAYCVAFQNKKRQNFRPLKIKRR